MNPEENYKEQARLYGSKDPDDKSRMRELRSALAEWVGRGGFKPSGWVGAAWKPAKKAAAPKGPAKRKILAALGSPSRGVTLSFADARALASEADLESLIRAGEIEVAPNNKGYRRNPTAPLSALERRPKGQRGFAVLSVLPQAGLLVLGAAAGPRLDAMIPYRPFGEKVPASVMAIPVAVGGAMVARHYGYNKTAQGLTSVAVGLAAGAVARGIQKRSGS